MNDDNTLSTAELEPTSEELAREEKELADLQKTVVYRNEGDTISQLLRDADYAALRCKQGDRERMILKNIRLSLWIVKWFLNRGLSREDLVQESMIGLMKAADRFDPQRGFRFSTYAVWWIKQCMNRAIENQSRDIRLPVHVYALRRSIHRTATRLGSELKRRPTIVEIQEATGLDLRKIKEAYSNSGTTIYSLDEPVMHDDGETSRSELVADTTIPRPDQALMDKEGGVERTRALVIRQLDSLKVISERNRDIFRVFHGLDHSVAIYRSLDTIGQMFGLTRERIRQVVAIVTRKLNEAYPQQDHKPDRTVRINRRKQTARRVMHIRASPAYIGWQPNGNADKHIPAVLDFINTSYELDDSDLTTPCQKKDVIWSRWFSTVILVEDVRIPRADIGPIFRGQLISVEDALMSFNYNIDVDPVIRQEVMDMREHFKKVMGL